MPIETDSQGRAGLVASNGHRYQLSSIELRRDNYFSPRPPRKPRLQRTLKLRRDAAYQWLGALASGAISVALMAWLARAIGPSEFALMGATLNASLIALVVMDGGWSALMYRELSRVPHETNAAHLPGAGFAYGLVLLIPCGIGLVIATPSAAVAIAATVCMFSVVLMNQRSSRLRAAQDFYGEALWQLGGRVCSALTIVGVVSLTLCCYRSDIPASAWVFLGWASGLMICLGYSARGWWQTPDWTTTRLLYPLAFSMLAVDLGIALMARGDLVLLSSVSKGLADKGESSVVEGYAASVRLVEAVLLVAAPLSNVVIAYLRSGSDQPLRRRLLRVSGLAFGFWLIGWLLWAMCATWSALIFEAIFGAAFVDGAPWLKWASLPLPWMLANLLLLQAAIAVAPSRMLGISVVGCGLIFVVVSALLLHWIGAAGVAIGAALAQALLSACLLYCLFAPNVKSTDLSQ